MTKPRQAGLGTQRGSFSCRDISGSTLIAFSTLLLPVAFRDFGACKFKTSPGATESDLSLARAMATRAAQLVTIAVTEARQPAPRSAAQIRREILGNGDRWVSFSNLVDYCWALGIPVIHLLCCPTAKRPDGLCARVKG